MTDTAIEADIQSIFEYDNSDPNRLTHIVHPANNPHLFRPGMSAQDVVDIARMTRREVVALCGYKWIPVADPDKYDICSFCVKIAESIIKKVG